MNLKSVSFLTGSIIVVFALVFALSTYLKVVPVLNYNFPFTMDQARDMIDIRRIVELKRPSLIGPTTSINGVFLGPFYYYFNLIPYLVSGGDPAALTYWNIAWYMAAGILLLVFFYKKDKAFALVASSIFMMAPANFYSSRYFWSANPMPYMTTFYFLSILNFFRKNSLVNAFLPGLIGGLSMQVEAAFGVLFFPFFFLFAIIKRTHFKYILSSMAGFFITLLPQIIFEIRNKFVMTQVFFNELTGESQILGERLTLPEVFENHLASYIDFSHGLFEMPKEYSAYLLGAAIVGLTILFIKKKLSKEENLIFLLSIGFVIFSFGFYMFYSHPLKGWYLLGLRVPYLLLIALFLSQVFKIHYIVKVLIVGFLVWSFFATYTSQSSFVPKPGEYSGDKSNFRNEVVAIDWVYTKAAGQGFKAYNYIPSVYDFPYQYLYWWYGKEKYGYHPEVVTYLDGVPEYIKDNDVFFDAKRKAEDSTAFLIYEKDEDMKRLHAWLGSFTHLCTVEKMEYSWGTTVELRRVCEEVNKETNQPADKQ